MEPMLPSDFSWIIRPEELHLGDDAHLIGRIARGQWQNNIVVVKVLFKQAEARELHARAELWTSLRHPNVLQIFGVSPLDADPLYIVAQCYPHNVLDFLEHNPSVVRDIAVGMRYLHQRGVIHGSLKPTNVLVGIDGQPCVADYGMIEIQTSGSYGHRYFSPEAWKGVETR